jgi:CheY-like chemotaxis protein
VIGMLRIVRDTELTSSQRDYIKTASDSAEALLLLLNDVLDFSKIEANRLELTHAPFSPATVARTAADLHHTRARDKGLQLDFRLGADLPSAILGDSSRVRQILVNLVSNAIKFTERGRVLVEAVRTPGGAVRLTVHDTGPGIDPAIQPRLFRPFTQADESTTRRYGGTGLGLSICRELAALMGGEVGLASRPGEGSSFWVELPLPETDARPDWAHTADADPELLRGAHVLLVEDNPVNMMIAAAMLEQWGLDVTQASDGPAAITAVEHAAARGRPFDVVLMDVQMPGMSGHEAARALRLRWSPRVLPIIALTAAALVSERDEAIAAGMDDFLTKPIDPAKLRDALMRQVLAVAP